MAPDYVSLGGSFYFDKKNRHILKKVGERYVFVRHDRRSTLFKKEVAHDRRSQAEAEAAHFQLIAGGLFWDPKEKSVYKKVGSQYLLYSRDRRKTQAPPPSGKDRRKP